MQIIPVLDLLDGIVVQGIAGQRQAYRAVQSRLVTVPDPRTVALAFRDQLGLPLLYVADLDAILHSRPNLNCYRELVAEKFRLLVDAGLRDLAGAEQVLATGVQQVIVGLETWPGPKSLAPLCRAIGPERVLFSLDLQAGEPLCDRAAWGDRQPLEIALAAIDAGVRQIIVLDLAQVGVGAGVDTLDLCWAILEQHRDVRLITGGGVRDLADLERLETLGIEGVLVASALHNGRIGRNEIAQIQAGPESLEQGNP
jgi:phosphoribosylformimino-5-aminoimidazole carboxamide ribotide isomerase